MPMNKRKFASLFGFLLTFSLPAFTANQYDADLWQIYQTSVKSDPTFREAYANYLSQKELLPIAWSNVLPTISGSSTYVKNDISTANILNGSNLNATYYTTTVGLKASQPLFNLAAWNGVKQASNQVKAAQASFNASAQILMLSVAKAYFDVLFAEDNVTYNIAKEKANYRQYEQAEQRFKVGLDAITSVYEAKAAYDDSRAETIGAKNNLINQKENLRKLTFKSYKKISPLKTGNIPLVTPNPKNVDTWIQTALRQNYVLAAAKYSAKSAKDNINLQASGHLPVLSLTGSYNSQRVDTNNPLVANDTTGTNFGLALSVPMFQGGLVVAKTRQAKHQYESSFSKLDSGYRDIIVNIHVAYNSVIDGMSKIKADRQAVISSKQSLESTEAQFKVGTRTMVDVVNAQERLFLSQTQLSKDQYAYINGILQLKYYAGTLSPMDLQEINTWLSGNTGTTRKTGAFDLNAPVDKPKA